MPIGEIIRWLASPDSVPSGIGGDANTIWHCAYEAFPNLIYELSSVDFSTVRSANAPAGGSYGIGGDANTIWHCNGFADKIYELSTADLSSVRDAASPSIGAKGIGGDANTIWHCDSNLDKNYELSTTDFSVVRSANSPDTTPTGIGGNAATIWHCDFDSSDVYELSTTDFSTVESGSSPSTNPRGIGGDTDILWHCDQDTDCVYELVPYILLPTISTDAATDVAKTTAQLNGTLDDDGYEACDCGFEYGTTIACEETTGTQSKETAETFLQSLTDLAKGMIYYFRAFATNSAGTAYGEILDFTTGSPRTTIAIEEKITLEAIRNIEMSARGRFRLSKDGNAVYRSRYARNL